jgi:hypothetical protein
MAISAAHPVRPGGHEVARPLPAPPRRVRRVRRDHVARALEAWLKEVRLRYTLGG